MISAVLGMISNWGHDMRNDTHDMLIREGWEEYIPNSGDKSGKEGLISEAECPIILEGARTDGESRILEGLLQRANARNRNGRIYPRSILERENAKMQRLITEKGGILGELDHPQTVTINMRNACQKVSHLQMDSQGIVEGRIELRPELPLGRFAIGCCDALGGKLGQSSRGSGTLFKRGSDILIGEDYSMKTYDAVHDESTYGARLETVSESLIREFEEFRTARPTTQKSMLVSLVDQYLFGTK